MTILTLFSVENNIRIITGIRYPDYPFRYLVTIIRQKFSDNPDNTYIFSFHFLMFVKQFSVLGLGLLINSFLFDISSSA